MRSSASPSGTLGGRRCDRLESDIIQAFKFVTPTDRLHRTWSRQAAYFNLTHTITDLDTDRNSGLWNVDGPELRTSEWWVYWFFQKIKLRGSNEEKFDTEDDFTLAPNFPLAVQIPFLVPMCIAEISSTDVAPTWPITMRSSALSISSTFSTPAWPKAANPQM